MKSPLVLLVWLLSSWRSAAQNNSVLFERGTIISFNNNSQSLEVLRNSSLLVTGDRIAAIFRSDNEASIPEGTERISAENLILSPGFIDTHRHTWQTAFKTIASNTTLAEYSFRYGEFANQNRFTADDIYSGQLVGLWESLNSGVTTVLDHAHGTFSNSTATAAVNASVDSGIRMAFGYAFHNLTNGFSFSEQMANFQDLLRDNRIESSLVGMGIAYDGFTSPANSMTQSVMDLARNSNISIFTTHNLGGPWISENSPRLLDSLNFLNNTFPIVFSHCSFITPVDVALLRQHNLFVSTTPESEMHYGHTHHFDAYVQDQAALGVDTHFTYSTDIVGQARIWLQSLRLKFFQKTINSWRIPSDNPMSVNQAFLLATRNGGLALRRPDLGVIQVGAKADIAVFDGTSPNMLGWRDPVAAIILHSHVGDVKHVLVGGNFRKRNGQLVTAVNRTEVEQQFLQSAERIQQELEDTPIPHLVGEFNDGIQFGPTEIVDVMRGNGTGY